MKKFNFTHNSVDTKTFSNKDVKYTGYLIFSVLLMFFLVFVSNAYAENFPSSDQVKADLIGQRIGNMYRSWVFASPSEFYKFNIKNKNISGLLLEYEISVILKPRSGPMGSADLVVVYKKENSSWKFINVTDNNTLKPIR